MPGAQESKFFNFIRTFCALQTFYIMKGEGSRMSENLCTLYDRIYRYCFYRVRNTVYAEDITQEAFLRYFEQKTELKSSEDTASWVPTAPVKRH